MKGVNMENNEYKMLTVEEVQEYIPFGRDKVYALMRSDSFPAMRIGRQYVVSKKNLLAWIDRNSGKVFNL